MSQTKTIPAKDVEQGQQLTAVAGETLRRRRGVWPTVTDRAYLEDGEGHQPTVYIETHERPGSTWCLDPDDTVTVVQCSEPTVPCPACVATDLNEETSMLARITMAVCFLIVGAILVLPMVWHH
jgi:hypothetical protein